MKEKIIEQIKKPRSNVVNYRNGNLDPIDSVSNPVRTYGTYFEKVRGAIGDLYSLIPDFGYVFDESAQPLTDGSRKEVVGDKWETPERTEIMRQMWVTGIAWAVENKRWTLDNLNKEAFCGALPIFDMPELFWKQGEVSETRKGHQEMKEKIEKIREDASAVATIVANPQDRYITDDTEIVGRYMSSPEKLTAFLQLVGMYTQVYRDCNKIMMNEQGIIPQGIEVQRVANTSLFTGAIIADFPILWQEKYNWNAHQEMLNKVLAIAVEALKLNDYGEVQARQIVRKGLLDKQ